MRVLVGYLKRVARAALLCSSDSESDVLTLGSDVLIRGPIAGRLHEILIQSANTKDLDFHRDDNPQSDALSTCPLSGHSRGRTPHPYKHGALGVPPLLPQTEDRMRDPTPPKWGRGPGGRREMWALPRTDATPI